jgi:hypothetical protein
VAFQLLDNSPFSFLSGEAQMATATLEPPSRSSPAPAPPVDSAATAPPAQPAARGIWTDWVAMVFWTACFALMAVMHLKDLLVSLVR